MVIWLIFFLFLQTKLSFCRMFAWFQLDFPAIPVSISAVSLTGRQTWQNVTNKRRLQRIQNVQEGKRHQKKRHLAAFVFVPSIFWGEVFNSLILNDISRNFLVGSRKKIAKCLMMRFTCCSTFLYAKKSSMPMKIDSLFDKC